MVVKADKLYEFLIMDKSEEEILQATVGYVIDKKKDGLLILRDADGLSIDQIKELIYSYKNEIDSDTLATYQEDIMKLYLAPINGRYYTKLGDKVTIQELEEEDF